MFPVVSSQVLRHHRTCVRAAMIKCGHVYQVLGGLYIFDCGQWWQPQPEWRRELAHNEGPVETWARADFRNASKGDECSFLKFLLRLPACGHVRSVATGIFSGLSSQRCCWKHAIFFFGAWPRSGIASIQWPAAQAWSCYALSFLRQCVTCWNPTR